ncbi:unnamed protein product [Leptosia nina]|uniref:Uncharacterized protein n=1 Tax=Leptosia nina TaxID=320188 RepID=A0AAV1J5C7_9NEOP
MKEKITEDIQVWSNLVVGAFKVLDVLGGVQCRKKDSFGSEQHKQNYRRSYKKNARGGVKHRAIERPGNLCVSETNDNRKRTNK